MEKFYKEGIGKRRKEEDVHSVKWKSANSYISYSAAIIVFFLPSLAAVVEIQAYLKFYI